MAVEHDRLVVDVAWRRAGRRRDLRADAYALIGSFAEATTSVVQRQDGDVVLFEVATGQPDGEFAPHGHLIVVRVERNDTALGRELTGRPRGSGFGARYGVAPSVTSPL